MFFLSASSTFQPTRFAPFQLSVICPTPEATFSRRGVARDDVTAGREFVEAYLPYVHYVERLWRDATSAAHGHHAEHAEEAEHMD